MSIFIFVTEIKHDYHINDSATIVYKNPHAKISTKQINHTKHIT